ncbi:hypothetical protein [Ponticaulis koreensis]|uniref:hypothetical protein n=1 Tax=Ponticaulis koreensis TaxID=1123045 RepID=UPI0003B394EA|nr:hypothetical protein [Ponticaulis koreensis]
MKIVPFVSVGEICFGDSLEQVEAALGRPNSSISRGNSTKNWYGKVEVTFKDNIVVDIGVAYPQKVTLEGVDIFNDPLGWKKICKLDGEPKSNYGIVVLPKYGVSFSGIHDGNDSQRSVGAFVKGLWDEILPSMQPFEDYK